MLLLDPLKWWAKATVSRQVTIKSTKTKRTAVVGLTVSLRHRDHQLYFMFLALTIRLGPSNTILSMIACKPVLPIPWCSSFWSLPPTQSLVLRPLPGSVIYYPDLFVTNVFMILWIFLNPRRKTKTKSSWMIWQKSVDNYVTVWHFADVYGFLARMLS